MFNIFIDGQEGTTGLQIHERLKERKDIHVLEIPPESRKDRDAKKAFYERADIVILCLPDEAAREAVALIGKDKTRVIDSSTAFRCDDAWTYGIPELYPGQRETIRNSQRVANPGCHATGFIMALYPLVREGIVPDDYPVVAYSLTGFSGGGKKLIAVYEGSPVVDERLQGPRHYALSLKHKHVPEMQKYAALRHPPLFMPVVGNFYKGMVVSVPLKTSLLKKKVAAQDVRDALADYYRGEAYVRVIPFASEASLDNGFLSPTDCNATNRIDLFVFGDNEQILLAARLDNLGKGASGAAVQNMNIMLGAEETAGLAVE